MKTVLLLEDEPALMRVMRHMLREYSLIGAASAEEALQLFTDHGRLIDLLVADVTLPRSSGIQVALLLRLEISNLPVILTSGYPVDGWSVRESKDLERLGSNSVTIFQKPFEPTVFLNAVRDLIGAPQQDMAGASGN